MVKNAVGLASQAIVALFVEQVTDPRWKLGKYTVVVAKQVSVVMLVKQLTNDPKVENSNLAAASIGWNW